MAQATDLIIVFLALELLLDPALRAGGAGLSQNGLGRSRIQSTSCWAHSPPVSVVYGIALTYGATGSTAFTGIAAAVSSGSIAGTTYAYNPLLLTVARR